MTPFPFPTDTPAFRKALALRATFGVTTGLTLRYLDPVIDRTLRAVPTPPVPGVTPALRAWLKA